MTKIVEKIQMSLTLKMATILLMMIALWLAFCKFFIVDPSNLSPFINQLAVSSPEKIPEVIFHQIIICHLLFFTIFILVIYILIKRFVLNPVRIILDATRNITDFNHAKDIHIPQKDEIGKLAFNINRLRKNISEKQDELIIKSNAYQNLFELVPCIITVQNKNFELIGYNQEFSDRFDPKVGDHCYSAYKGRNEKCLSCPVEKTFEDGLHHYSEETGVNRDGTRTHWIVKTSPMKDENGNVVAAMEMSLDITHKKELEKQLEKSENKYHAIFNNIPNPVFIIEKETLEIIDCNGSVKSVYGFDKKDIISRSFLSLFLEKDSKNIISRLQKCRFIDRIVHKKKDGELIFVNIRISPSEYPDKNVLLVTTSDISRSIETENQLIQAGKMATLGRMSTGIAHELNQPLTVIKTASNFFLRKIKKNEVIDKDTFLTMSEEIDKHVERASKIINHLRVFGRKSDLSLERININETLKRSYEIFNQQLKIRGIKVIWQLEENLPEIMGDDSRIEQVFINLLINARDAIEERAEKEENNSFEKKITVRSRLKNNKVVIKVSDTGCGICEKIRNRLFDPFFTTKKIGEGTGLGLSISYGIIKECGGEIKIDRDSAEGAVFIIILPVAEGGGNE